MRKIIVINETQLDRITENLTLTELKFYNAIRSLLKSLLVKPLSFDYPTILQVNGVDKESLLDRLIENNLLVKSEKLVDLDEEGNHIKPKLSISYLVPKNNFELKLRKLYSSMFEDDNLVECESGGATGADSAGSFVGPLNDNPILKRKLK